MVPYTVAVLADIHGNLAAFDAVLADLAAQPHDAAVIAGDLLVNGPRPAETLARVRASGIPAIAGNTEWSLARRRGAPDEDHPIFGWVRDRLSADDLAWLATLPLDYRVTPPGRVSPGDDLLVVHATPADPFPVIITELHPLGTTFTAPTPEAEVAALLGDARANLILYGHIHYASSGTVGEQRLASIGAVGFPFDGDPRAAYSLVSWDGREWRVAHRRVAYDHRAVIAEIARSDMPEKATLTRRLVEANWIPMP